MYMKCSICESEACHKKHRCDDKAWMVHIIVALADHVGSDPEEVKEALDKEVELTPEEFFLCWKSAELLSEWRTT